ncbi:flagellar basal-body rod protein FlgF [Phyllobacterium sp. 21LDTY02-6]|uniref:flagellar basal-body rod protein FlgF n=1 Tax=Phyllobacterium sp. 21LDTY02-6 TaxID=2944903 RepID=UPI0020208BBD|nr:flagellar basal-body rod protein FlgF [Phyllobacterium sp. 21LDTY02-6]MCO4315645.1 flagellar basal-body rod protein FlgF [Phyllobacterium sp. 21LDTY02-6]
MQNSIYVGLSSQISLERRLDALAHNVANMSTPGFRATGMKFDAMVSKAAEDSSFVTAGESYIKTEPGPITQTGNPLDVAVKGDVWFALQSPAGQVYTRDGRMKMSPVGELLSVKGYPILDAGGQPLIIDPNGGPPQISADGAVYQNGRQLGAIGLYSIDAKAKLDYFDNSAVIPSVAAQPVLDNPNAGVIQGAVEGSNVDAISEMTRLMSVTRAFERVDALLRSNESTVSEAIKTLGSSNG